MSSRLVVRKNGCSNINGLFSKSRRDTKNKMYRIMIKQKLNCRDKNQSKRNNNRKKKLVESIEWLRSPETWRSR